MPIANYTTTISADKSISEIQVMLRTAGARSVLVEFDDDGEPALLAFQVDICDRRIPFRLPSNWRGVLVRLQKDPKVEPRYATEEHARRVAWRILKDWVRAQMAIIDAGLVDLPEVFLPYAVQNDRTLYEAFRDEWRLLPGG